jgi:energy-coupling factor transport system substrate-specific component
MVSGAVYALVLVKPIAHGLARAGVLKGTALAEAMTAVAPAGMRRA